VIRLTHKGFALYNGVDDKIISEEIRPYIYGRGTIQGIDVNQTGYAWAAQSVNPPLYYAACATDSSSAALNRVFVYDLIRSTWTICDYPVGFQCLNAVPLGSQAPTLVGGEASTGNPTRIMNLSNGSTTDLGAPVAWEFHTRAESGRSPLQNNFYRRVVLTFEADLTTSVTFTVTVGETDLTPIVRTLTVGSAAVWGTAKWGSFLWGSQSKTRSTVTIDINRTGETAQLKVVGTKPVRMRGIEWHLKPKPITRMAS
jgi:hypothetical protein